MDVYVSLNNACYLSLVILRDVAEEFTSLPEQDILLTELFLQELLQHKN